MRAGPNLLIFEFVSVALAHPHHWRTRPRAMYSALRAERGRGRTLVAEGLDEALDRIAARRRARRNDS